MRWSVMTLVRAFAVFAVVVATANNTERWICNSDDPPEGDGWTIHDYDPPSGGWAIYEGARSTYRSIREGTRFPYRSIHGECASFRDHVEQSAPLDHGLFAVIALVSAILWPRSVPSGPLRLPLGAEPLPPEATARNDRRLRGMVVRSASCLAVTLLGAFQGLAFAFGLAGWWYARHLCGRYEMLGRRPHWMAVAASRIAPAIVATSLLIALGILLEWWAWRM